MVELAKNIVINHWGTILSSRRLKLNEDGYIKITEGKDLVDTDDSVMSLQQYLNHKKEKPLQFPHYTRMKNYSGFISGCIFQNTHFLFCYGAQKIYKAKYHRKSRITKALAIL